MPKQKDKSQKHRLLLILLNDLENELRKQGIWQTDRPSQSALNSVQPFAIDTLTFAQWLQFIFLEKMNELVQFALPLPQSISVHPMAEEYFKHQFIDSREIIAIIARLDSLISEK